MESTFQYDPLDTTEVGATFQDLPECGDSHLTEGLPLPNIVQAPNEETVVKPVVGMEFDCLEKSYDFYNEYARFVGFSVRRAKNRRSHIDGELLYQNFCCSREGQLRKKSEDDVANKKRKSERVGCPARLDVKRANNGIWSVTKFDEEHNHELAKHRDKHLLRSQRRRLYDSAEMRTTRGIYYFTGESGESAQRKIFEKGDMKVVLDYFTQMKSEDPSFFYAVQAKEDQIINFFWSDARSRRDFGYFGDVIYFRRTYGLTKYGRPFAPIFGVNHHLQTIMFGCAILLTETEDSYAWLFETLIKAMCGHCPSAIITDQDAAMAKAIERVLPGTQHRLCLSHIFDEATKHLSDLADSNDGFITEMKRCISEPQWVDDFESRWAALLEKYQVSNNEWLDDMYNKRQHTFPVYCRHVFHADMMTTQRVESINSFFSGYLNDTFPVEEFIKEYEKALAHRREEEATYDIHSQNTKPTLTLEVPMEQQAADKFTGVLFNEFHKQFTGSFNYLAEETAQDGTKWTYAVSRWGHSRNCLVTFISCDDDDFQVTCDCQNFEFTGILCRHIFKIFTVRNIMLVPRAYFKKRWTKKAKYGVVLYENKEVEFDYQNSLALRYTDLCHLSFNLCAKAAASEEEYENAKNKLEKILRKLENVTEEDMTITRPNMTITQPNIDYEDMTITQPDIDQTLDPPAEVVDNIGSSNYHPDEENLTLTSPTQAAHKVWQVVDKKKNGQNATSDGWNVAHGRNTFKVRSKNKPSSNPTDSAPDTIAASTNTDPTQKEIEIPSIQPRGSRYVVLDQIDNEDSDAEAVAELGLSTPVSNSEENPMQVVEVIKTKDATAVPGSAATGIERQGEDPTVPMDWLTPQAINVLNSEIARIGRDALVTEIKSLLEAKAAKVGQNTIEEEHEVTTIQPPTEYVPRRSSRSKKTNPKFR